MRFLQSVKRFLLATAAVAAFTGTANAGLLGDTVDTQYLGFGDSGVVSTVVGAGEEGNFFFNQFFDYSDEGFTIRSTSDFCGIFACSGFDVSLILSSLDFGEDLVDVVFVTNLVGVSMIHTTNSVTFTWSEQAITTGTYLTARFITGEVPVPEPTSVALMGLALLGFAASRRRKQA